MTVANLCTACGAEKYRNPSGKIYCKQCAASFCRTWNEKNRESVRAKKHDHYLRNREAVNAKTRAYYQANRAALLAASLEWHRSHPELVRQYKRRWVEKNADRGRAYAAQRRALKAGAVCEHGDQCVPLDAFTLISGQLCIYCGESAEHADHYVPLALGGKHCRTNIVPACARCNLSKGALLPDEWASKLRGEVA